MNTRTSFNQPRFTLLVALLSAGALAAQGCGGDDDNPEPSNPVVSGGASGSSGRGGGAGKGGKGGTSSGGTQSEGGTGDTGNEGGTGDVGTGGSSGGSSGRGGSGSSGRGGSDGSGAAAGNGDGGTGAEGAEGGSGAEGGQIDCEVRGERNCYRCAPEAEDPAPEWPAPLNEQFLNHCDDAVCSPFDNAERIEGWDGTLPTP